MQNFLNSKTNIVDDAIDGAIAAGGGSIGRYDVDNSARVVARRDFDRSRVAIVSGGGSGHEPAHAGFVGEGMLSAAVCGEIFASPSIDAVLSAILSVTGEAGCLLVVKNYTGDRLNFGLAAEKAKGMGLRVEMVVVGDDISIPNAPQPRGVSGTLLIHKIAGFMSERGDSLDSIHTVVSQAAKKLYTIGAARDTCSIPGSEKQNRLADDEVEIGLGIHGEPGVAVARFDTPAELIADMVGRLKSVLPDNDARFALMFNSLGGLSVIETAVLFADVMRTDIADRVDLLIGPAALMTALDMPGFSLTLFELNDLSIEALRADVGPQAWARVVDKCTEAFIDAPNMPPARTFLSSDDPNVRKIVKTIADTCIAFESEINELDARVGDGDTGSTFALAGRTVLARLDDLPLAIGSDLLQAFSRITSQTVGGSSGVLFGILFAGASEKFATTNNWAVSLSHGLSLMQKYGGARLGDRTMIDALKPAFGILEAGGTLQEACYAARQGAELTATMQDAKAGRSSYLSSRSLDGVMDPGAAAIARLFEALMQ